MFHFLVSVAGRRVQEEHAPQAMAASVCWSLSEAASQKANCFFITATELVFFLPHAPPLIITRKYLSVPSNNVPIFILNN